jgi:hypothetical protein
MLEHLPRRALGREPKVDDTNRLLAVEEQVLGLDVAVHNIVCVQVRDARHDLVEEAPPLILAQPPRLYNVLEELAAGGKLHDEVDAVGGMDDLPEPNHVRVFELLEDLDLAPDPLDVVRLLHPSLLEHLDRHLLASELMRSLHYGAKGALTELVADGISADRRWHAALQATTAQADARGRHGAALF